VKVFAYIYYMSQRKSPRRAVREPVQVYLAPDDRKLLDSLAKATGLSRAEVLRRGIRSFAAVARSGGVKGPMLAYLDETVDEEWPEDIAERHDEFLALQHSSS
jgi:Ribbon-helix-helix protein, copG family